MSNSYFTASSAIADFTRARASQVNSIATAVEAAFDLVPNPTVLSKIATPAVTAGGTANALTITNTNAITSYALGQRIAFKASITNTGATTVNVDGLGVKNLLRADGSNLSAADLYIGRMYEAIYDGTNFQLVLNVVDISASGVGSYIASITASATAASNAETAAEAAQTAAETAQGLAEDAQTAAEAAAASFTAASLLTSIKTVDGAASGLDADLLQGVTPGAGGLAILDDASEAAIRTTLGLTTAANPVFTGVATFPAGSASAPSVTTSGDTNTGVYFSAADQVAIACGGATIVTVSSNSVTFAQEILAPAGNVSTPSYTFSGDPDTGMYQSGTGEISFTLNGTYALQLTTTQFVLNSALYDSIVMAGTKTPASAGATGTAGQICFDSNYIYRCVATNTWKRAALSTW